MKQEHKSIHELEEKISYSFIDKNLLIVALTHTSFINEQSHPKEQQINLHNERLEFLGDAVLEIIISEEIFTRYPNQREGLLTHFRSSLVNENTLATMAENLNLHTYLKLGKGEENQGGRKRPSILSDAFEALLAAIYLDAQKNPLYENPLTPIKKLILSLYKDYWPENLKPKEKKDYKTLLQEYTQSYFKDTPKYALIASDGPEHEKVFTVELILPNSTSIKESGTSKKTAEQKAAEKALKILLQTSKSSI